VDVEDLQVAEVSFQEEAEGSEVVAMAKDINAMMASTGIHLATQKGQGLDMWLLMITNPH
jgi:hypothetical protein